MKADNGRVSVELYKKYRPQRFADLVGQKEVVATLTEMVKNQRVPHALLLSGGSGTGKTTVARILAKQIGCARVDYEEINAAEARGIDTVRDIAQQMNLKPMQGSCRVWCLDEAHHLTRRAGGDAQTALLKILEDTPEHVYFILCTTNAQELLPTIHTRCTQIKFEPLLPRDLTSLIQRVAQAERLTLTAEVVERLVETADGSARKALVLLHQIVGLESAEDQLAVIQKPAARQQAFDIVRALLWQKTSWDEVMKVLVGVDEDPESLRHLVLANATNEMLKKGGRHARAFLVITAFESSFFASGKAGLVRACWEVLQNRN